MLFAIIKKELLLVRRDIHSLAVLFLMPTAFIIIMSLSLQDSFEEEKGNDKKIAVGLVFQSAADKKTALGQALMKIEGFSVRQYANYQLMTSSMQHDHLVAGLVLPAGLISSVQKNTKIKASDRLHLHYAATTPGYIRKLVHSSANRAVVSFQLDKLLASMTPDPLARKAQKERFLGDTLLVENEWVSQRVPSGVIETKLKNIPHSKPSSVQQTVPAWLIFSMFFVVIPISMTFLVEKQLGTLQRLRTMPVPSGYLMTGKLVPYLGINLLQALLMFLVGIYLVPMIGGEGLVLSNNAWLLIPMTLCISLAAISFALFIATFVKSTEQATTIGGTSNLLLGAIGGVMVPTFIMPEVMQNVAQLSPMNWGLEGFLSILLKQGDLASILPEMVKLIIFALCFFLLAMLFYRRKTIF